MIACAAAAGTALYMNSLSKEEVSSKKEIAESKTASVPNQTKTEPKKAEKEIYLTFDDGPSTLTPQFLELLKKENIKATFFMQGVNLQNTSLQPYVKQAVKEGHYVGSHSMTHDYDSLYNKKQFVNEMKESLALIHTITGTNPKLVRPPYGSAPGLNDKDIIHDIVASDIKVWDWSIDSMDWNLANNPKQILVNIQEQTTEKREVVLMHETPQTLQMLPEIIEYYRQEGYTFMVYRDDAHFPMNFQNNKQL